MTRAAAIAGALCCLIASSTAAGTSPVAPTTHNAQLDYLDPANRGVPIACKAGDHEREPGRSMADLFGSDWPVPTASAASLPRVRVTVQAKGKLKLPSRLLGKKALVVVAVLVDADGKPVRAKSICATSNGFDDVARRAVMGSSFRPALLGGQPVASPVTVVISFNGHNLRYLDLERG